MTKLDVKKTQKALYSGRNGEWDLIDVPPMTYLSLSGQGDPEGEAYQTALARLYPLAYKLKFISKAAGADYVVPPLEAQWWADDPTAFTTNDRAAWKWRVLLRVPVDVTDDMLEDARAKAGAETATVEMIEITEGPSFQTLHIGPYTDEGPTLAHLHDTIMPQAGMTFGQPHHEIYLSDPRRVAPEKLKTILRQPVVPA